MQARSVRNKCGYVLAALCGTLFLMGATARAEATWMQWPMAGSPSNVHHDATYDSAGQRIVLCGRADGGFGPDGQALSYFCTVNEGWQPGPAINSVSGSDIEVSYDPDRNVTVLYTVTNSTVPVVFELAGGAWVQRAINTNLVACGDGALMRYDPLRRKTVLVGCTNAMPTAAAASQTWLWDGTNWTQTAESPVGAAGGSMTFDEARGVMVLLPFYATNTWTFDGTTWTAHQSASIPTPSVWVGKMAYDPVNEMAVQFGGEKAPATYPTNTWAWNGSDWQMLSTPVCPPATIDMAMLWFPPINAMVMHGGWGPADSWAWRNSVWIFSNAPAITPPQNVAASDGTYADKVAVTWQAVSGATGYKVYRGDTADSAQASLLGTTTGAAYDDTAVILNTPYYYWVKATNASGPSAFSLPDVGWSSNSNVPPVVVSSQSVAADFDGDARADPALFNTNGTWKLKLSSGNYAMIPLAGFLGDSGAAALAADFDGDAKADPAVYYDALELWAVKLSSLNYLAPTVLTGFGGAGWQAVAGDFDGDRFADPALYNTNGNWQVKLSTAGYQTIPLTGLLGFAGWTAVAADFDGDGKVDPAVYRAETGSWIVLLSKANYALAVLEPGFLGGSGYTGMAADFDGDGYADPAVAKPSNGNWQIKLSSGNYSLVDLQNFLGE